jgi:hypothetical protein
MLKRARSIKIPVLKASLTAFAILGIVAGVLSQSHESVASRKIENDVFKHGEFLEYRVFYDSWLTYWMTAGIGTMKVSDEPAVVDGQETYHIEVQGNSTGIFTLFYKVRDRFETYLDKDSFLPHKFIRRTREGKFRLDDDVYFDHTGGYAQSSRAKKPIPPGVQDIISAFYYMRTIDFDTARADDEYFLDFFLDDSVYTSKIIFLGREWVDTDMGKFYCMKFKPKVAQGDLFKEPYPMQLWVTDDMNKIPVKAKSAVYIGSITLELTDYKNLKYPLGTQEHK